MNLTFFSYLLKYVFTARTRQNLLVLAFLGLFFSSFSLLAIQGLMGGLQNGVITRSKNVEGVAEIHLRPSMSEEKRLQLESLLHKHGAQFSKELVSELMLKKAGRVLPLKLHGVDLLYLPTFLQPFKKYFKRSGFVFPYDFAYRLDMEIGDNFTLIAPAETLYSLTGVPRMAVGIADKFFYTNVPEVDQIEGWTSLPFLQNFLRKKMVNTIRIFKCDDLSSLSIEIKDRYSDDLIFNFWEETHSDLAWALNLESKIMFSLFLSVIFLVSISIISGQLIFWSKIKQDLVGMWILGASRIKIFTSALVSFTLLNALAVLLGLLASILALKLFGLYGGDILPDIFVDRKVPILITPLSLFLSFILPVAVSTLFCGYTLKVLMKDTDFLELLRA